MRRRRRAVQRCDAGCRRLDGCATETDDVYDEALTTVGHACASVPLSVGGAPLSQAAHTALVNMKRSPLLRSSVRPLAPARRTTLK